LQNAEREKVRLLYCAFDLIYLDDQDLREHPLIERKELLEKILPRDPVLQYSTHVWDKGIAAFKRAARAGEEGVMAKLATSHYHSGQRTRDWLKVKSSLGQEVVVVGFTAPRRSREYFGSLLLAVREGKTWRYVGRAGTGFDREALKSLHALMVPLITTSKPVPEKVPDEGNTTWIKPKLVGEVKFTEWTAKGEMRHPVFLGLRADKKATDVIREEPKPGARPAP
jgi:bifunctional non-homologous end joining protein LigD